MDGSWTASEMRLRDALSHTSDQALLQIVQFLDDLPQRPDHLEQILAEARPRLRTLRPARPLRFTRLLFMPLEGVIVPGSAWEPGRDSLPRAALVPIAHSLRDAMESAAASMDSVLAGRTDADADLVGALGTTLWTIAAMLAPQMKPPGEETLPDEEFRALVALCAKVWRHGEALWKVMRHAPNPAPDPLLRDLLRAVAEDRAALAPVLATLFHDVTLPGTMASAARDAAPDITDAVDEALDRWIGRCVTEADLATPALVARTAERVGTVIEDLEAGGWLGRGARRNAINDLRLKVEGACQDAFVGVAGDFLMEQRLATGPVEAGTPADGLGQLLRRLDAVGRRLSGGALYDGMMRRLFGGTDVKLFRARIPDEA